MASGVHGSKAEIDRSDIEEACAVPGDTIKWHDPMHGVGYFMYLLHLNCGRNRPRALALDERPKSYENVELKCGTVTDGSQSVEVYTGRCAKCKTTFLAMRC